MAANSDIRSDLHRIAQSIAARSGATTISEDDSTIAGPVGTFRDALLARYHEGYIEGLHDMAEAVVGYLTARGTPTDPRLPESQGPERASDFNRNAS